MKNSFDNLFDYINAVNNENKINSPKKINKKLALGVNLLAIALLTSGGYGIKYILDQQEDIQNTKALQEELMLNSQKKADEIKQAILNNKETKEEEKTNTYRDFKKLKEENNDTVGWLYVPGTKIDMPIVQGKNNKYYLTHNFEKKNNSMGWAFADYQNTFPELSDNTIMYGHTYKRTTIFSNLKNILEKSWLNNSSNHIITFDTEKERLKFKVFSIYTIDATNDYLYINFENRDEYQKYLNRELKRSIKNFKVEVTSSDKIITLSTCYIDENHRLVLHAKLIGAE